MSPLTIRANTRNKPVPPLENGDRLTRDEFERRYRAMPPQVKAELVDGVVYMASPVRHESHGHADGRLVFWLGYYQALTLGVDFSVNTTIRLDDDNEPQPDSFLFVLPEFGGRVRISEDDYVENAPDLIVEIAASTVSLDLGPKLQEYAANEAREYLVWRTLDEAIDWFVLREGVYVPLSPDETGIIRSDVFPGLWLNIPAALRRDSAAILATLQQGIQSPEHARFVAELQARRTS